MIYFLERASEWSYTENGLKSGQYWRLVTAHFTHYTLQHLLLNLAGCLLIFWGFQRIVRLFSYCVAILVGIVCIDLHLWYYDIAEYAGMSGILNSMLTIALTELLFQQSKRLKFLALTCMAVLTIKLGLEYTEISFVDHEGFQVYHPAHLVGALSGILGWLLHSKLKGTSLAKINKSPLSL